MSQNVLTIAQLNDYIASKLDADPLLATVAVRGEISNHKVYPSGHHYFSLKDETSTLKCVMFRGYTASLKFKPDNGMKVIAMGRISVYPRDGVYQLYCTAIAMDGVGDLYAAYEQLKKKLEAQGMFDPAHKQPLPPYPKTIGIVTSPAGAAVHDMLRILKKRYPLVKAVIIPVRVQGAEAPGEIAAAIQYANAYQLADLLIVGRGGGSLEDLWAFNEECVAHAIYQSKIPVISAVGHEPDVALSDFVADLRAATPSNAAELAVPERSALQQTLDSCALAMVNVLKARLAGHKRHLRALAESKVLTNPDAYIQQRKLTLAHIQSRIVSVQQRNIQRYRNKFISCTAKLDALSPLAVLSRGYSIVQDEAGGVVRSTTQAAINDTVSITLSDGKITANITAIEEVTE